MRFFKLRWLKKMYQKAKQFFSFDTDRSKNFNSLPKPTRRKDKSVNAVESDETPWRFSYVRASNSLRRYGNRSRAGYSASDGSLGSSREDLLGPPGKLLRRRRLNITKQSCSKYKNGNSSSEDLLNDESDWTEEPFSSGMPETDGSVFSSQENILDPANRCSANVSRFLRRKSSDKSKTALDSEESRCSPLPHIFKSTVEVHQSPEERNHSISKSMTIKHNMRSKSMTIIPNEGKETNGSPDHLVVVRPSSAAGDVAVWDAPLCVVPQTVLSDNTRPITQRLQVAVVKTIHRLTNYINNVKGEVDVLESKCSVLKEALHQLRQDHDDLAVKITGLAGVQYGQHTDKTLSYEEHDVHDKCRCTEDSYSYIEEVHGSSTDNKEVLRQMNTVKKKSHRPSMFSFVTILMVTAVVWDIRSAGSFEGSKLGQTVRRLGLMPYLVTAGEYAKSSFIYSYRWCATNVPVYYSRGCELAGPYLLLMLEKVEWVMGYGWTAMESATQYIPPLKEKIETSLPGLTSSVSHYGGVGIQLLQDGFLYVRNASSPYLTQAHDFASTRIFVGPLAPEKLQEYVVGAADYVSQLFLQLHSGLVKVLEEANNSTKTS